MLPNLYWMLECKQCGRRRVVHDSYLEFVGSSSGIPGAGYAWTPLTERYQCMNGCSRGMRAIGSIFQPDDTTMWLHEPHTQVELSEAQRAEWKQLIREAHVSKP